MIRAIGGGIMIVLMSPGIFGQPTEFEVASVKPSDPTGTVGIRRLPGGRFVTSNTSLGPNPSLVNVTTKGGGHQFHGQAFEFVRNDIFDARNFFSAAKDNLKRNQFAGAFGGPIRKDKLWFYGYYEGLRQIETVTSNAYTPTAAMFGADRIFDGNADRHSIANRLLCSRWVHPNRSHRKNEA